MRLKPFKLVGKANRHRAACLMTLLPARIIMLITLLPQAQAIDVAGLRSASRQ